MLSHYLKINRKIIITILIGVIIGFVCNHMMDSVAQILEQHYMGISSLTEQEANKYQMIQGVLTIITMLLTGLIMAAALVITYYPFSRKRRKVMFTLYGQRKVVMFQIISTFAIIVIMAIAMNLANGMAFINAFQVLVITFCFTQAVYFMVELLVHTNIKYLSKGKKFKKLLPWICYSVVLLITAWLELVIIGDIQGILYQTSDLLNNNNLNELNEIIRTNMYGMNEFIYIQLIIYGLLNYGYVIASKNKVGI